jgi:hypothetical protein
LYDLYELDVDYKINFKNVNDYLFKYAFFQLNNIDFISHKIKLGLDALDLNLLNQQTACDQYLFSYLEFEFKKNKSLMNCNVKTERRKKEMLNILSSAPHEMNRYKRYIYSTIIITELKIYKIYSHLFALHLFVEIMLHTCDNSFLIKDRKVEDIKYDLMRFPYIDKKSIYDINWLSTNEKTLYTHELGIFMKLFMTHKT